jgi:hypothetical protein
MTPYGHSGSGRARAGDPIQQPQRRGGDHARPPKNANHPWSAALAVLELHTVPRRSAGMPRGRQRSDRSARPAGSFAPRAAGYELRRSPLGRRRGTGSCFAAMPSAASSVTRANRAFGGTTCSTAAAACRRILTSASSSAIRTRAAASAVDSTCSGVGDLTPRSSRSRDFSGAGKTRRCPATRRHRAPSVRSRADRGHDAGIAAGKASARQTISFTRSSDPTSPHLRVR